MMPTMKPSKGQIWQNNKTGALVKVAAIARDSENPEVARVQYRHLTGPDQKPWSRVMEGTEFAFVNKFTICTCWGCEFSKLVVPTEQPDNKVRRRWVCYHGRKPMYVADRDYACCAAWQTDSEKVGG